MSLLDIDERAKITIGEEYIYNHTSHIDYKFLKREGTSSETKSAILKFINDISLEEVFLLKKFLHEDMKINSEVKAISYVNSANQNIMVILMLAGGVCVLMVRYCKK